MPHASAPPSTHIPRPPWRQTRLVLATLLSAGAAAGVALTVAACFGERAWWLELTTHFRGQYGVGLACVAGGLALLKYFRAAAALALVAVVNLALPAAYYFGRPAPPAADAPRLKILYLNVLLANQHRDLVRALLEAEQPDVFAVAEVDNAWLAALRLVTDSYPHRLERPGSHAFGIAVYARVPLRDARQIPLPPLNAATITARLPLGGTEVSALFTHVMSPQSAGALAARNGQLVNLAQWARAQTHPPLILGDLNCTPFSPYFTQLLRDGGLRDTARGFGWQPTWPSWFRPLLMIPIDHALAGPGITIVERRTGPYVGSDHLAVIVTIAPAAAD